MSKKTYEELNKIFDEVQNENKRVSLSIKLGICPVCGEKFVNEREEMFDKPRKQIFGLFTEYSKVWDFRIICPTSKQHYERKHNNDYNY